MTNYKSFLKNIIFPGLILSTITGIFTGIIIFFYRYIAELLTKYSNKSYSYVRDHLYFIPILFGVLFLFAYIMYLIGREIKTSRGGGIPTSEGIIRGSISYNWLLTLIGCIISSFMSFFAGLPLGAEGPSVQIGTAIGSGTQKIVDKKEKAWNRYIMTSGAAAAFSVATSAPITGVLFALEEIHKKFSPMILMVSFTSVLGASITAHYLSDITGFEYALFSFESLAKIAYSKYFWFIIFGILVGILAYCFNKIVAAAQLLFDDKMKQVHPFIKLLIPFTLTGILGLVLLKSIGGGHGLIIDIFNNKIGIGLLIGLILIKLIMIPLASQSGATGGMFIPILLIGALVGGIFGKILEAMGYGELYSIFVVTGMSAFMASSISCPLSAIVFSIEILGGGYITLPISLAIIMSYIMKEVLKTQPIYDIVLERKLKLEYSKKSFSLIEVNVTVNEKSFACDKQTRDLLLPANTIILSVKRQNKDYAKMDNFGDKILHTGDILHLKCQTYSLIDTKRELEAFLGNQQNFEDNVTIVQK